MRNKYLLTSVLILFLVTGLKAQENKPVNKNEYKTIFNSGKDKQVSHGGYGAFNIGYTNIDGKSAMQMGMRGAWIINHYIALGLGGKGFFNHLSKTDNPLDYYLAGGYGGFYFEPIIAPNSPIHVSFPILIGGGGVSTIPQNYLDGDFNDFAYDYDIFFVFEPGVEIEFNLARFFRLGIGASYRLTNGVIIKYPLSPEIPTNVLNALNFYVIFKFGKF